MMSLCSGMYQNQPFLPLRLQHQRRALVPAGVAIGALEVGPDRALLQRRILFEQPEPVPSMRLWPLASTTTSRVTPPRSPSSYWTRTPRPGRLEQHLADAHALVHLDAVLARVLAASSGRTRCAAPARSASTRAGCGR